MNKIEQLIENGIRVTKATFHSAVDSAYGTAENRLLHKSDNKQRQAEMWITDLGLLFHQNKKYTLVPLANVIASDLEFHE